MEPSGIEIEVREGETLMAAAVRGGYRWPTVCGGLAQCGACAVQIVGDAGSLDLDPPSGLEAARLATLPDRKLHPDAEFRLACQLRPDGVDLVVRKKGVRPTD